MNRNERRRDRQPFTPSVTKRARRARPTIRRLIPGISALEDRALLSLIPTTTYLSVSPATSFFGQGVTLTATIVAQGSTQPSQGGVAFTDGGRGLTGAILSGNTASVTLPIPPPRSAALSLGLNQLAAIYGGDGAQFAGSTSTVVITSPIATVAGNGSFGYSGDGGAATSAEFNGPASVAVDGAGDLFIADANNNVVREVTPSGTISTVAGNGGLGYSGDGGQATAARLDDPLGVAVDASGDVFIADAGNDVIREVKPSGVISTVAGNGHTGFTGDGGQATSATLNSPTGVATDAQGDVLIADAGNSAIREVKPSGIISTVAGDGTAGYSGDGGLATVAKLHAPVGVAVDGLGDIFIADSKNSVIREVKPSGNISTVAGNGSLGYSGDNGPATSAQLDDPVGVAADAGGDIFIADAGNDVIRMVNLPGTIVTIAGDGAAGYSGDGGPASSSALNNPVDVAVDPNSNLFIADEGNEVIRKVAATFPAVQLPVPTTLSIGASPSPGIFGQPVTFSGSVSNASSGSISYRDGVVPIGGFSLGDMPPNLSTVALGVGTHLITAVFQGPPTVGGSDVILLPSSPVATVAGDGTVGYGGDGGAATSATLHSPDSIAMDANGDIFIADTNNSVIREVTPAGVITTVAGNGSPGYSGDGGAATSANLDDPEGIAVDAQGDLFIADEGNSVIREVNGKTGVITTVAGNGNIGYSGDGGAATAAKLFNPFGVALDAQGDLFIADAGNNAIREVNASGIITTVAGDGIASYSGDGGPAKSARLDDPTGIAVDARGDLFIADSKNNVIREVNGTSGVITTIAGDGKAGYGGDGGLATAATLDDPLRVTLNFDGDLYIADSKNNAIREVNLSGIMSTVAGNGTAGYSGDGGSLSSVVLNSPRGVVTDPQGDLFIADTGNARIRRVTAGMLVTIVPGPGTTPTSTTLSAAPSPSTFGQSVTFTATVATVPPGGATPTGFVTFVDGSTTLGSGSLSNAGVAKFSTAGLAVGAHSIRAVYSGDAKDQASVAATINLIVNVKATQTVLSASPSSPVFGQPVTFTATVGVQGAGTGTPTGMVTFVDGSTTLGTGTLNNAGVATFTTTTSLALGAHTINAVYGGDTNDQGSTAASLGLTIGQDSTSTTLAASPTSSIFGEPVGFTAIVSVQSPGAGTPTGTVRFKDGSTTLGTGTLNNAGIATFQTSSLSLGTHTITAVYIGDAGDLTSTSPAIGFTVGQDKTTTTVGASVATPTFGQSVTFTAAVNVQGPGAGTPTGLVTFKDGATTLGTVALNAGVATFSTTGLGVGPHAIAAVYGGDTNDQASTASAINLSVGLDSTNTKITAQANPVAFGQSATFTATVSTQPPGTGTPTGIVTFVDGSTTLGTGALGGGAASFSTTGLALGLHSITAVYGGDLNNQMSVSSTFTLNIAQDATVTMVGASTSSPVFGQAVVFTGTVSVINAGPGAGTPTGTLTFKDGTTTLGTGTLTNGLATFATATLGVGPHAITAVYGGDTNDQAGTASALNLTVGQDVTKTRLTSSVTTSSSSSSAFGQAVTFTATLAVQGAGLGIPTGTVTFKEGNALLGTGALNGGVATFTTSSLAVASHAITAFYGGDTNDQGSVDGPLNLSVGQDFTTIVLSASPSPPLSGRPVTITATVSPLPPGAGTPTGNITFGDGATLLGTGTLSNGVATLTTTSLGAAAHALTADYGGDFNDQGSIATPLQINIGQDTPDDFDGVGHSQLAIFRPSTAQWIIAGNAQPIGFGAANLYDIPVPGDYDGTGRTELAVFRPSTGQWFIAGHAQPISFGATNLFDIPVPGDYDGTGRTELAVFRPSTGQWFIAGHAQPINFGAPNLHDIPVPGDYDGTGRTELAVFRPSTGQWFIAGHAQPIGFGAPNLYDIPVPGDYGGTGKTQLAVFRLSTAQWFIAGNPQPVSFGATNLFDFPLEGPSGSLALLFRVGALGTPTLHASSFPTAASTSSPSTRPTDQILGPVPSALGEDGSIPVTPAGKKAHSPSANPDVWLAAIEAMADERPAA